MPGTPSKPKSARTAAAQAATEQASLVGAEDAADEIQPLKKADVPKGKGKGAASPRKPVPSTDANKIKALESNIKSLAKKLDIAEANAAELFESQGEHMQTVVDLTTSVSNQMDEQSEEFVNVKASIEDVKETLLDLVQQVTGPKRSVQRRVPKFIKDDESVDTDDDYFDDGYDDTGFKDEGGLSLTHGQFLTYMNLVEGQSVPNFVTQERVELMELLQSSSNYTVAKNTVMQDMLDAVARMATRYGARSDATAIMCQPYFLMKIQHKYGYVQKASLAHIFKRIHHNPDAYDEDLIEKLTTFEMTATKALKTTTATVGDESTEVKDLKSQLAKQKKRAKQAEDRARKPGGRRQGQQSGDGATTPKKGG